MRLKNILQYNHTSDYFYLTIIHDLACQFHVFKGGNVPDKHLVIDGVGFILFLGRLFVSHVLVKDGIVLFQFKLDIGITLLKVERKRKSERQNDVVVA